MKTRFTHIINPVHKPPDHELSIAQPVTFRSIDAARRFLHNTRAEAVQLVCAVYEEDEYLVPKDADQVVRLGRSFRDVAGRQRAPKLPLMREVLACGADVATSEYLVYSNIDIALQPYFYNVLAGHIESGVESLVINRRTIHPAQGERDKLDLLYAMLGSSHPGYDCFVFRRADLQSFVLGELSLGLPGFDWIMALNLWYRGGKHLGLYEEHLTFHLGDDRKWTSDAFLEWQRLNYDQIHEPLASLKAQFGDHEHFLWPRTRPAERSLFHRVMNRLGRELVRQWPSQ